VIDSGFRQLGLLGEQAQALGRGGGTVTPATPGQTAPRAPQPQQQPAAPTPRR
jgi:biopolymer transport protein TolR